MNIHRARFCMLALACTLLTACQDRRQPVKPTVHHVNPAQAGAQ